MKAVVYTDGSCLGNPSNDWGCGLHGYLYSEDNINKKSGNKPNGFDITVDGYIKNIVNAGDSDYLPRTVIPSMYIDGYGSYTSKGSNNTGEIMGMVLTMEELIKYNDELKEDKLDEIKILTDSTYVIHIYNTIVSDEEKNWKITVDKNLSYWHIVDDRLEKLKASGIEISLHKVAGHSDNVGNDTSDRLAYLGRTISLEQNIEESSVHYTEEKKYWSNSDIKHPLLNYRNIFFLNTTAATVDYNYVVMNYKTNVEIGTKTKEAIFGLVVVKKPIVEIENVKNIFQEKLGSLKLLAAVDLVTLYSRKNLLYSKLFGNKVYNYNNKTRKSIDLLGEDTICYDIFPPGIALQSENKVIELKTYLKYYIDNTSPANVDISDVTDIFYTKNDKKKSVINFTNLDKNVELPYKKHKLVLEFGTDLPTRNQLNKIAGDNPKISLLIKNTTDKYLEYYVIIECEKTGLLSIWCNFYTNGFYTVKK